MVHLDHPFKNKAGVVSSGVFSSLSASDQTEAVDQLCDMLGYKTSAQKQKPTEALEEPTDIEKPL